MGNWVVILLLLIVVALIFYYKNRLIYGSNEERWALIGVNNSDADSKRWGPYMKENYPDIDYYKVDLNCPEDLNKAKETKCIPVNFDNPATLGRLKGIMKKWTPKQQPGFDKIIFDASVIKFAKFGPNLANLHEYLRPNGQIYIPLEFCTYTVGPAHGHPVKKVTNYESYKNILMSYYKEHMNRKSLILGNLFPPCPTIFYGDKSVPPEWKMQVYMESFHEYNMQRLKEITGKTIKYIDSRDKYPIPDHPEYPVINHGFYLIE